MAQKAPQKQSVTTRRAQLISKYTSWRLWDGRTEKDFVGFADSKENNTVGLYCWSKEGTVGHRQSKEASILWSYYEETTELLPGERDNARNNARCTQARKTTHGWTTSRRGQDCPWKSQSERQRTEIKRESTSMVWPTLGSRTAKEQNSRYVSSSRL